MRLRAYGCAVVALLAVWASGAAASIDINGRWLVTTSFGTVCIDITQTASVLSGVECGISGVPYTGSIDVDTGVFTLRQPPACNYTAIAATAAPDSQSFVGTVNFSIYHCSFLTCGCLEFDDNPAVGTRDACGDGYANGASGEQCDDGNTVDGDCCSSTCQFEPYGSPCPDGNPCTVDETCGGSGFCNVQPAPEGTVCRPAANACDSAETCPGFDFTCPPPHLDGPSTGCLPAGTSSMTLKNSTNNRRDKLVWKWGKGPALSTLDFADPTDSDSYALCVYAGTASALVAGAALPAGSGWSPLRSTGYKFAGSSPQGLTSAVLKSGVTRKSKAVAKGKGEALPDPDLPFSYPVTVQLRKVGASLCLESVFTSADEKQNDTTQFKAKH